MTAQPPPGPRALRRFWSNVDRSGPLIRPELGLCWTWLRQVNENGYGRLSSGPRGSEVRYYAHRVAFLVTHGRWPEPCALHRCDNRRCVNPAHLVEGTRPENHADMVEKGRHAAPTRKSHCLRGHDFAVTGVDMPNGDRYCRECRRVHKRAIRARAQAANAKQGRSPSRSAAT